MYSRTYKNSSLRLSSWSLAFGLNACTKNKGSRVVVKGSTTVLPITQKAAEAFHKSAGISVFVEGSGSGNGIKALIDGGCDIANSSREMKPEEKAAAAGKRNPGQGNTRRL